MRAFPATFRTRLFRVLIVIGVTAACLVSLTISALDISITRRFLIEDAQQGTYLTAQMAALDIVRHQPLTELFALFPHIRGLDMVCIYDKENQLVQHWQARIQGQCPSFIRQTGTSETFFSIHIAEPVQSNGIYLGMVYIQAQLLERGPMLLRVAGIFISLILVALLACTLAAHHGARHINHLMDAIRQQIECLKDNTSECLLPPASATSETLTLFEAIRSLRVHLVTLLVPKETLWHQREWYENIFFSLFSLLRRRLPADSSLITLLGDCELLLRLNNPDEPLAAPEAADINRLVDDGLSSARKLHPPQTQIHLTVSFKHATVSEWSVRGEYLSALIRHLLLIALARTQAGLICLRLEIVMKPEKMHQAMLVWRLEDSGPPLQPGELHSRLVDMQYKIISVAEASWLLASQLTKRLGGEIHGENAPGGLLLSGEIPLDYAYSSGLALSPAHRTASPSAIPRLLLMVGDASIDSHALCHLLERSHFRVLWAASMVQALELAPALPFSAIILNAPSRDREIGHALRRLHALMENKTMPDIPLWVLTASQAGASHEEWQRAGADQIVSVPVKQEKLLSLCYELQPFDRRFWGEYDNGLLQEFSKTVKTHLPFMRRELLGQIQRVQVAIASPPSKPYTQEVAHNVHAIKSAALALGYMRLAALMANLEQMLADAQTATTSRNIAVIAECLKALALE